MLLSLGLSSNRRTLIQFVRNAGNCLPVRLQNISVYVSTTVRVSNIGIPFSKSVRSKFKLLRIEISTETLL